MASVLWCPVIQVQLLWQTLLDSFLFWKNHRHWRWCWKMLSSDIKSVNDMYVCILIYNLYVFCKTNKKFLHHSASSWPPPVSRSSPVGWTAVGSPWCWSPVGSSLSAVCVQQPLCRRGNLPGVPAQTEGCGGGGVASVPGLQAPRQKTLCQQDRCPSPYHPMVGCCSDSPSLNRRSLPPHRFLQLRHRYRNTAGFIEETGSRSVWGL